MATIQLGGEREINEYSEFSPEFYCAYEGKLVQIYGLFSRRSKQVLPIDSKINSLK